MAKHTNNAEILHDIKDFLFNVVVFIWCCFCTMFLTVMYDRVYTPYDTYTNVIVTGLILLDYYLCFKIYKTLVKKCEETIRKWKLKDEKKPVHRAKTTKTSTR